jgi:hypothetical protein
VCDGWLLRERSKGGTWRRQWVVLKLEGLLVFDGVAERVPTAHVAIDAAATVEVEESTGSPLASPGSPARVDPWLATSAQHRRPPAFTLYTTGGRVHTFACDPSPASPGARRAPPASAQDWVRAIRSVVAKCSA